MAVTWQNQNVGSAIVSIAGSASTDQIPTHSVKGINTNDSITATAETVGLSVLYDIVNWSITGGGYDIERTVKQNVINN